MELTRTGYGARALLILFCFTLHYGLLEGRVLKKPKHAVQEEAAQKFEMPKGSFCKDHSYCFKYSDLDCPSEWVELNCPKLCRRCEYEGPKVLKLPTVLYYKKGEKKHGISGQKKPKTKHSKRIVKKSADDKRDVVFLSKPSDYTPTETPPTTSYTLFDYKGNYRKWMFLYPDQHPVNLHYGTESNTADQQQQQQNSGTQDQTGAAAASTASSAPAAAAPAAATSAAAPAVTVTAGAAGLTAAPAAPATPAVGTAQAPVGQKPVVQQPVVAQNQAMAVPQSQPAVAAAQPANQTIELINQTVSVAANATQAPVAVGAVQTGFQPAVANVMQPKKTVSQAVVGGAADATTAAFPAAQANVPGQQAAAQGTVDVTSTSNQAVTQDVTVDPNPPEQNTEQSSDCCDPDAKPVTPKDCKPCPKMPKAPPVPYVFNIYCDDLYKDCAYGYSNCNDTWWQINCPKRCNLCKAKDTVNDTSTKTKEIYPNTVTDLPEKNELESDLVAPAAGDKPLVAKYTLRVKPKLKNGVPQTQEIRIMPPSKVAGFTGSVKPLMVLKQNITKPMIENIEIDVPKKGAKYSSKPSVEVIEGNHKEMLKVSKGQAVVEDQNAAQKSNTKKEEVQTEKPKEEAPKQDTSEQPQQTPATEAPATEAPATEAPATQAPVTQAPATQAAQYAASYETETAAQPAAQAALATPVNPQPAAETTAAYSDVQTCTDDTQCSVYSDERCAEDWLQTNCRSKCKLC